MIESFIGKKQNVVHRKQGGVYGDPTAELYFCPL